MNANANANPIEIGTIFSATWGSSMTLVDFYEVVGITKSGKSVKVRQIRSDRASEEDRSGDFKVIPIPGDFRGDAMTKRLQVASWGNNETFFNPGGSRFAAFVWDGTPQTVNTYD